MVAATDLVVRGQYWVAAPPADGKGPMEVDLYCCRAISVEDNSAVFRSIKNFKKNMTLSDEPLLRTLFVFTCDRVYRSRKAARKAAEQYNNGNTDRFVHTPWEILDKPQMKEKWKEQWIWKS